MGAWRCGLPSSSTHRCTRCATVRFWSSNVGPLEIDRQGRMMIPVHLRTYAALENDVLVLGAIDRVELWEPGRWEEKVGPEEQRLIEGADD